MVIQCSHCQAKFKLADDKLKPEGTKVRCSKCKEVFTVFPEEMPPPPPSVPVPSGTQANFELETSAAPAEASPETQGPAFAGSTLASDEFSFDASDIFSDSTPAPAAEPETQSESFDSFFDDQQPTPQSEEITPQGVDVAEEPPPSPTNNGDSDLGFGEFSFDSAEPPAPPTVAPPTEPSSFDDSAFDFGDVPTSATSQATDTGGDTFDFGETPTDFSFEQPAAPTSAQAFDFDENAFAAPEENSAPNFESPSFDSETAEADEVPLSTPAVETAEEQPVFTQSAAPTTAPERPQKAAAAAKSSKTAIPKPPPRFRISPLAIILRSLFILFLASAGAMIYFYYRPGIIDTKQLLGDLIGKTVVKQESGQIRIGSLAASYVTNSQAGELLVIQGEAINEFSSARSAISVRASLLDKSGKILQQRTAFCGNPLSTSALQNLSFAEIEKAMNNQFGELMSNLNVAGGKTIPFTIVFQKFPKGMSEYSVEVLDSKPGVQ